MTTTKNTRKQATRARNLYLLVAAACALVVYVHFGTGHEPTTFSNVLVTAGLFSIYRAGVVAPRKTRRTRRAAR